MINDIYIYIYEPFNRMAEVDARLVCPVILVSTLGPKVLQCEPAHP